MTGEQRDFLDTHSVGVLATNARTGRPRQSLVYFARDGDRLLISTLADQRRARHGGQLHREPSDRRHMSQRALAGLG